MTFSEVVDTRSTISAPGNQLKYDDNNNVPSFTEFKLEEFKMTSANAPAPHRLREARRSFVLYLEPNPDTPIQMSLKQFQDKILVQFGPNQAHNTPAHISILNRVLVERGQDFSTKWKTVDDLVNVIDQEIKKRQLLKPPEFSSFEILDKPTKSLVINVRLSSEYQSLANSIDNELSSKCNVLELSPMDRIHLAYNLLNSISKLALKRMKEKAEEIIDIYDWVKTGGSWRVVLYEIMVESQVVGVPHQLTEIKTWPLQNTNTNEFKLSNALPVSLRIKLSVLSSWFRNSTPFSSQTKKVMLSQQPTNAVVLRNKNRSRNK